MIVKPIADVQWRRMMENRIARLEKKTHLQPIEREKTSFELKESPLAQKIMRATAAHFELDLPMLKHKCHAVAYSHPRYVAMYLIYNLVPLCSLPVVARWFDVHHTTVLYAVRKISNFRKTDKHLDNLLQALAGDVGSELGREREG